MCHLFLAGNLTDNYCKKKKKKECFHLYEVPRIHSKIQRQEAECWLLGERELLFNGYKVSVWDDENVLKMHSGDGCITMRMHLTLLSCTLKSG